MGHTRDFQRIKLGRVKLCQNLPDGPACGFLLIETEGYCLDVTCLEEEGPFRFMDFPTQFVPVDVLNYSPPKRIWFALQLQVFW